MTTTTNKAKSPNRHAHFPADVDDEKKEHQKILTIRYGKDQMILIRKRLRVEAWLYDSLETLANENKCNGELEERQRVEEGGLTNGPAVHSEIDIDIDQILDIEGECERRQWLQEKLKDCKASTKAVQEFINEFLDRLKTL